MGVCDHACASEGPCKSTRPISAATRSAHAHKARTLHLALALLRAARADSARAGQRRHVEEGDNHGRVVDDLLLLHPARAGLGHKNVDGLARVVDARNEVEHLRAARGGEGRRQRGEGVSKGRPRARARKASVPLRNSPPGWT